MPDTSPNDPAARDAGGTLEARLRAAREARGLSLTDVQQETRIPADVLQRLEDGRLLGDASFSPVYLRALLKAYAGAVGMRQEEVMDAFDPGSRRLVADPPRAVAVGTSPPTPPDPVAEARPVGARRPAPGGAKEAPAEAAPVERAPAGKAPARAVPAEKSQRGDAAEKAVADSGPAAREDPAAPSAPAPSARDAPARPEGPAPAPEASVPAATSDEAVPAPAGPSVSAPAVSALAAGRGVGTPGSAATAGKRRVMSAAQARTPRAFDRSWGLIIGGTVALALVFAGMLYLLFRDRTPAPAARPRAVAADTAQVPDTTVAEAPAPPAPAGPTLATPIRVTVTAGAGGLQNFRVTAEPSARLGHWIEEGASMTFESPTAVVLWGEAAEGLDDGAVIELQGLRWTPADGRVLRIDPQAGQRLLDSLSGNG